LKCAQRNLHLLIITNHQFEILSHRSWLASRTPIVRILRARTPLLHLNNFIIIILLEKATIGFHLPIKRLLLLFKVQQYLIMKVLVIDERLEVLEPAVTLLPFYQLLHIDGSFYRRDSSFLSGVHFLKAFELFAQ
jgi:hypothetical protein